MPKSKEEIIAELRQIHDQVLEGYGWRGVPQLSDLSKEEREFFESSVKRPPTQLDVTTAKAIYIYKQQVEGSSKGT